MKSIVRWYAYRKEKEDDNLSYKVTGSHGSKSYARSCETLASAQAYCDDAKEKGYSGIKVVDGQGKVLTPEQVDTLCVKGTL